MARSIGVVMTGKIMVGLLDDHTLCSEIRHYPTDPDQTDALVELPMDELIQVICDEIVIVAGSCGGNIDAIGIALPGIVRNGVIEDCPNLQQLKGARIKDLLTAALAEKGITAQVVAVNDADAIAAGVAAKFGQMDRLVRVWTLGYGIGYGRYPYAEGIWEGGHTVVTLDHKETYCGCGGRGHLEGIMGHRAMRLRFLDMEPEEVFAAAKTGDARCLDFVKLWHRGLAAATAQCIHMDGPGKFYFSGYNVRYLDLNMLREYLHQMVKMSPLQSYKLEIIQLSDEIAISGAGVTAIQASDR